MTVSATSRAPLKEEPVTDHFFAQISATVSLVMYPCIYYWSYKRMTVYFILHLQNPVPPTWVFALLLVGAPEPSRMVLRGSSHLRMRCVNWRMVCWAVEELRENDMESPKYYQPSLLFTKQEQIPLYSSHWQSRHKCVDPCCCLKRCKRSVMYLEGMREACLVFPEFWRASFWCIVHSSLIVFKSVWIASMGVNQVYGSVCVSVTK